MAHEVWLNSRCFGGRRVVGVFRERTRLGFFVHIQLGDIPRCTTGFPNRVENPIFELSNVPEGAKEIRFSLTDRDAPGFNHGGGTADYTGDNVIQPGAFKYQSPCPPSGQHTYEWSSRARDADGDALARAKSRQKYP